MVLQRDAQRSSQHAIIGRLPALLQLLPPPIALPLPPMLACNPHQLLCLFSAALSQSCFPSLWLPHIPTCCNTSSAATGGESKVPAMVAEMQAAWEAAAGRTCFAVQAAARDMFLAGPCSRPSSLETTHPSPISSNNAGGTNVCYKRGCCKNKSMGCEQVQTLESGKEKGCWGKITGLNQ